jgi:hypothetical protein
LVGGGNAYVAAGRINSIDPDPASQTLFNARMSLCAMFDQDGRFVKRMLREQDVLAIIGQARRPFIGFIGDADLSAIATTGRSTRFSQTRLNSDGGQRRANLQKMVWYVERHRILPQAVGN